MQPATTDDAAAVADLVHSAYRAQESRAGWTTEADLLGGQRVDTAMVLELVGRPDSVILIVRDPSSGTLLACCHLERRGSGAYLGMVAVRPGRQGRGLGRALLEEAQTWAGTTWGSLWWEITVLAQRPELIAWYERRGFVLTGEHQDFPYGDERYGIPRRADLVLLGMRKGTRSQPSIRSTVTKA